MNKKSCHRTGTRIPVETDGIQVNFCKNPLCANYGVPASVDKQPRGRGAVSRGRDSYTLIGSSKGKGKKIPSLHCHKCDEYPTLKSNQGIADEARRFYSFLEEKKITCPNTACDNHSVSIDAGKLYYSSFGKTSGGSQRFKCKSCNKVFTVRKPTAGQRTPHKNKTVFSLLVNKVPFKRICEVADINPKTLYDKINFIHKQCLAFVGERERKLMNKHLERVYISTDRQEYVVNWTKRDDKRNVKLTAIGSADNQTGYVFGMHLNYDPSIDAMEIESKALLCGDYEDPHPFRRYARFWLQGDYDQAVKSSAANKRVAGLTHQITSEYDIAIQREDVEASETTDGFQRLPANGVQVHSEYSMYGHFFHLHKLLGNADKVRFFLDQDSGIRAACLSAFQQEVLNRSCDAFYVRLNKDLTVDEKRRVLRESRQLFKDVQANHPDLTENEVKLMLIKQRMANMQEIGKWKDRWLLHPFPNMSEPEKAICYLTNYNDYDEEHQAWLYNKASMHGIDCFFMQVRRRLSLLERPIASASAARRMWYGYSAYNPTVIMKLLDIFRVYYNYCLAGKNKQTPAMRLGLAKGKVPLEDIIYYQ